MREVQLALKRVVDILLSIVALIILSPFFLIIMIWIKLDDVRSPVFFKQERLGRDGKAFGIIKFRSMIPNAEHMGEGLRVSSEHDPRITKPGRILRKTSFDELPQLANVLTGDMALVGPRPPATYHPYDGASNYPAAGQARFQMRPGITGLAQVKLRNAASWDERIHLDVDYVKHFSLWLDAKILFLTVLRIVKPQGIYGESKDK